MVLALIRTIWAQPDPAAVREQLDAVADKLAPGFPVVAAMLREAREDVTAFAAFPFGHWKKIWSIPETEPTSGVGSCGARRSVPGGDAGRTAKEASVVDAMSR